MGNSTLVSHQYAPGDGGLQSSMYGNGDSVAYSYDDLDRVTAKSENGSRRYTWDYNADGQVGNHSDLVNGKDYRYSYDETGRLVRTDISDGSWFQNDYNTMDLSTGVRYHFSGVTREINYGYSERDYLPASTSITSSRVVSSGYDTLGRLTERSYTTASQPVTVSYDYRDWATVENRTTGIVNHIGYSVNGGTSLSDLYYVYDRNGNITQVRAGSTSSAPLLEKYTYDSKDQLVRHDSSTLGKTYSYSYDAGRNITAVCEYNYTTGSLPDACLTRKEYSYGDAQWKDLLTGYNGSKIRYDEIGNMISFNIS